MNPSNELTEADSLVVDSEQLSQDLTKLSEDLYRRLDEKLQLSAPTISESPARNLALVKLEQVRYRKIEDVAQSIKSLFSTLSRRDTPLVYIIDQDTKRSDEPIRLYIGSYHDRPLVGVQKEIELKLVESSIRGFLPGCQMTLLRDPEPKKVEQQDEQQQGKQVGEPEPKTEKELLLDNLMSQSAHCVLYGIPSERRQEKDEKKDSVTCHGLEQLVDSTQFLQKLTVVVFAQPVEQKEILDARSHLGSLKDAVSIDVKRTEQYSFSVQEGKNRSTSISETNQESTSISNSDGESRAMKAHLGKSALSLWRQQWNFRKKHRAQETERMRSASYQKTINISETTQKGTSKTTGETNGSSIGTTAGHTSSVERTCEQAKYLVENLDKLLKRLDQGIGSGMWRTVVHVFASSDDNARAATNVLGGLLSGSESSAGPLQQLCFAKSNKPGYRALDLNEYEVFPETLLGREFGGISTLITSSELGLIARLPTHEVPGIIVEKLTDYGRNQARQSSDGIVVGKLVDREAKTLTDVKIGLDQIQRHCFVTGVTGSGKSNTMRHLVRELWNEKRTIPFLVIEPVKSEYRMLKDVFGEDLRILELGSPSEEFSLNPFDFERDLEGGLVMHIDNLKASFNATMGTYSSMPFILEDIIYKVYAQNGWDFSSNNNSIEATIRQVHKDIHPDTCIPRMSDMLPLVEESIQSFFPQQTDYGGSLLGAMRARISSMTRGAKGHLLDRPVTTLSTRDLLSKPCVVELGSFADNDEKAFVMALILIKIYEYRHSQDVLNRGKAPSGLEHVLIIEEAHRLLSKPSPAGEHSSHGRQKGVEVFSDMLAEIRSYGQGIVIVDQIPSKLTPDVLKNTDVKIAHRVVDKEDREVIGGTMNLDEDQMKDLARSGPGRATVYFSGLRQALRVQIRNTPLVKLRDEQAQDDLGADVGPRADDEPVVEKAKLLVEKVERILLDQPSIVLDSDQRERAAIHAMRVIVVAVVAGSRVLGELRPGLVQQLSEWFNVDNEDACGLILQEGVLRAASILEEMGCESAVSQSFAMLGMKLIREWVDGVEAVDAVAALKAQNYFMSLDPAGQEPGTASSLMDHLVRLLVVPLFGEEFNPTMERALLEFCNETQTSESMDALLDEYASRLAFGYGTALPDSSLSNLKLCIFTKFSSDDERVLTAAGYMMSFLRNRWRNFSEGDAS